MNSLFDVSGKVAVVTGGSGVLGSNISEGLLKAGAKVAVIGAHFDRVEKALERLRTTGGEVCGFTCNVLDMDSLREVKEKVLAQWGRVDILVNAAGGNIPGGTLTETQHVFDMKVEDLNKVVDLNLSEKIRVNAIAPGFFIGNQNRGVLINPDGSLTERSRKVIAKTPMRRFGDISELNGAVQFLCSEAASFITGVTLPIDGGFSSFSGV